MFSALIVVALLSQIDPSGPARAPVDCDYRPAAGDLALMGSVDREEESAGRRARIEPADCYGSADAAREAFELVVSREDDRLDPAPDAYRIRAGTPATVRERRTVEIRRDGRPSKLFLYRVEVMQGEFKDRLLWVSGAGLFRFKAREG
jgi:hypothetical protein